MRVVAVSAESSLAAALNMMDGWEVVFAREGEDVGRVAAGAAVVLAGGGTVHGLALVSELRAQGMDVPAVVLGDIDPPDDAGSPVLRPPFTLDELRTTVEDAVRSANAAATAAAATPAPSIPARPTPEPPAPPPVPTPDVVRPSAIEPPATPPAAEGNGSLGHGPDLREIAIPRPAPIDPPEAQAPSPEPRSPAAESAEQPSDEVAAEHDVVPRTAAAPSTPAVDPIVDDPDRGKRRKRRRDRDAAPVPPIVQRPVAEGSVDSRLRLAEQAVRAIEDVIGELPFLADIEALSSAVVGEVVEAFSPEIVALYLPAGDGYWVAGGHQLTPAERRLSVKPDHPLFRELLATGEPMLIAPLDLARAMVSGIAGARTEAMIAGPVQGTAGCVGVVIVGRGDFNDKDLDTLAHLTSEAASGLAVALGIDRLRSRRR